MRHFKTELETWRSVATGTQSGWEVRARTIAKFLRATDQIVDLGAGDQKLGRYIPETCAYFPVDCVSSHPTTHVTDFNSEFTLPEVEEPTFVCAGLLEYIVDWKRFFSKLRATAPGATLIASYFFDDKSTRQEMITSNNFTSPDEVLRELSMHLDQLNVLWIEKKTVIISATLSEGGRLVDPHPLYSDQESYRANRSWFSRALRR